MLIAYLARFLTVGFNPVESGLQRVTRSIDEAAASLGVVGTDLIRKVHVPLLRTSLGDGGDLGVRRRDEGNADHVDHASAGLGHAGGARVGDDVRRRGERAALPAVAIVLVGLIPAAMLTRRGAHVA